MFNNKEIQSLTEENQQLKERINRLLGTMAEYESYTQEKIRELKQTIQTLQERLKQSNLVNPRGAGRKSRITDDVLSCSVSMGTCLFRNIFSVSMGTCLFRNIFN